MFGPSHLREIISCLLIRPSQPHRLSDRVHSWRASRHCSDLLITSASPLRAREVKRGVTKQRRGCASGPGELAAHLSLISGPDIWHNCPLCSADVKSLTHQGLILSYLEECCNEMLMLAGVNAKGTASMVQRWSIKNRVSLFQLELWKPPLLLLLLESLPGV